MISNSRQLEWWVTGVTFIQLRWGYIQGQVHPGEVSSWSRRDYTHSVFLFFSFPPFFPEALKIKFLWNGPYLSTVFYRHRICKYIVRVKIAQYNCLYQGVADCWGHCQRFYRIWKTLKSLLCGGRTTLPWEAIQFFFLRISLLECAFFNWVHMPESLN